MYLCIWFIDYVSLIMLLLGLHYCYYIVIILLLLLFLCMKYLCIYHLFIYLYDLLIVLV